MPAGRTRPLLIECSHVTGSGRERARFVTKAIGLPEVHSLSLAHELIGSRLARLFGLLAPEAHVVSISREFIAASTPEFAAQGLRPQAGLAIGTDFIPDLMPFPVPVRLIGDDEMMQAAAIYAFDQLTQNPDRSAANPNCGRTGRGIISYDFETAFSFRLAVVRRDAWRVAGLPFAKKHLLHAALKSCHPDWAAAFTRFKAVPLASVAEACSTIPEEWAAIGRDVLTHFATLYEHWLEFEQEIVQSLESSS